MLAFCFFKEFYERCQHQHERYMYGNGDRRRQLFCDYNCPLLSVVQVVAILALSTRGYTERLAKLLQQREYNNRGKQVNAISLPLNIFHLCYALVVEPFNIICMATFMTSVIWSKFISGHLQADYQQHEQSIYTGSPSINQPSSWLSAILVEYILWYLFAYIRRSYKHWNYYPLRVEYQHFTDRNCLRFVSFDTDDTDEEQRTELFADDLVRKICFGSTPGAFRVRSNKNLL